jgi:hypothetical protein
MCANCGELSIAIVDGYTGTYGNDSNAWRTVLDKASPRWQPRAVSAPDFPDVPGHVARAAKEAYETHSVGDDIAAILMARTTIEATAKDKGITKGTLLVKIDELEKQQLIRPSVAKAAHAIRYMGNDMAHGDINEPPTSEEADDVLKLMSIVLNEIYIATALTEAVLARHTKPDSSASDIHT